MHELGIAHGHGGNKDAYEMSGKLTHKHDESESTEDSIKELPGCKSKAIKTLTPWFPQIISEYSEPFIGGGSIAIQITKLYPDIPVWINDLYVPLYNFWTQLRDRGEELSERVREEKQRTLDAGDKDKVTEKAKELFNKYKEEIDTYDDFEKAVAFFIMNKCSLFWSNREQYFFTNSI